jgi:hypothetical protein
MIRKYSIRIYINDRWFDEIWIDSHYEEKHKDSISDEIIIGLIKNLSYQVFIPAAESHNGWEYFKTQPIYYGKKAYRLIWLTHKNEIYVGIRNAFRINWRKK